MDIQKHHCITLEVLRCISHLIDRRTAAQDSIEILLQPPSPTVYVKSPTQLTELATRLSEEASNDPDNPTARLVLRLLAPLRDLDILLGHNAGVRAISHSSIYTPSSRPGAQLGMAHPSHHHRRLSSIFHFPRGRWKRTMVCSGVIDFPHRKTRVW